MARVERVEAQIKQAVGRILHGELRDPRVGFLTVIRVSVSADLQHAHVYVSCLGPAAQRQEALTALVTAQGYVRRLLGQRLRMRYTPTIEFHLDASIDAQFRIQQTLDHLYHEEPDHDHAT